MDQCSNNLVSFKYLNHGKKHTTFFIFDQAAFKLRSFILPQAAAPLLTAAPRAKELSLIALAQQGRCIYSVAALKVFPR